MGDRYERSKPTKEISEKKKKLKKKDSAGLKMKAKQSVLQDSDEIAGIVYRPKTDETKQTYEVRPDRYSMCRFHDLTDVRDQS